MDTGLQSQGCSAVTLLPELPSLLRPKQSQPQRQGLCVPLGVCGADAAETTQQLQERPRCMLHGMHSPIKVVWGRCAASAHYLPAPNRRAPPHPLWGPLPSLRSKPSVPGAPVTAASAGPGQDGFSGGAPQPHAPAVEIVRHVNAVHDGKHSWHDPACDRAQRLASAPQQRRYGRRNCHCEIARRTEFGQRLQLQAAPASEDGR